MPTSRERGRERGSHTRTSCDSEPSCKGGKEALDKRIVIDGKNDNSGSHRVGLDLRQYVFAKTSVAYLLMRTFSKVLRCGKPGHLSATLAETCEKIIFLPTFVNFILIFYFKSTL